MVSRIYGIPSKDCWKRVHFLEGVGLVRVVLKSLTREGQVLQFYQKASNPIAVEVEDRPTAYVQPAW